ncbi:hypothetical protein F5883DRAFT_656715 [Diaporthe sp. PMI_573]|nr:hypothetical protein F5883DRAFT_656715 [Diaporthaceae sp. PMI_573]
MRAFAKIAVDAGKYGVFSGLRLNEARSNAYARSIDGKLPIAILVLGPLSAVQLVLAHTTVLFEFHSAKVFKVVLDLAIGKCEPQLARARWEVALQRSAIASLAAGQA